MRTKAITFVLALALLAVPVQRANADTVPYPGQVGLTTQYVSMVAGAMPADRVTITTGTARVLAFVPWDHAPDAPIVWWLHPHSYNYASMFKAEALMIDSWIARGWIVLSIDATGN